jgi:glycosyltransferase involved in cell wall biosynthesis
METPKVSVIIPTRHNEDISMCLNAVKASSYKNIEIVVVDEGLERSAQRNIGITLAKGEYLLVLDSDQAVSKYLIDICVGILHYRKDIKALYIPEEIPGKSFFNRVRNFERQFYTGTCVDVVRFVRRGCPLFDKSMSGPEDSDWDRRIGGERKTVKGGRLYHYDNMTLKKYIAKKSYYAKSMKLYHEKHPDDKVLNLWYRCIGIFIENGKWKQLIKHPILTLGIVFILAVRGVIYICSK